MTTEKSPNPYAEILSRRAPRRAVQAYTSRNSLARVPCLSSMAPITDRQTHQSRAVLPVPPRASPRNNLLPDLMQKARGGLLKHDWSPREASERVGVFKPASAPYRPSVNKDSSTPSSNVRKLSAASAVRNLSTSSVRKSTPSSNVWQGSRQLTTVRQPLSSPPNGKRPSPPSSNVNRSTRNVDTTTRPPHHVTPPPTSQSTNPLTTSSFQKGGKGSPKTIRHRRRHRRPPLPPPPPLSLHRPSTPQQPSLNPHKRSNQIRLSAKCPPEFATRASELPPDRSRHGEPGGHAREEGVPLPRPDNSDRRPQNFMHLAPAKSKNVDGCVTERPVRTGRNAQEHRKNCETVCGDIRREGEMSLPVTNHTSTRTRKRTRTPAPVSVPPSPAPIQKPDVSVTSPRSPTCKPPSPTRQLGTVQLSSSSIRKLGLPTPPARTPTFKTSDTDGINPCNASSADGALSKSDPKFANGQQCKAGDSRVRYVTSDNDQSNQACARPLKKRRVVEQPNDCASHVERGTHAESKKQPTETKSAMQKTKDLDLSKLEPQSKTAHTNPVEVSPISIVEAPFAISFEDPAALELSRLNHNVRDEKCAFFRHDHPAERKQSARSRASLSFERTSCKLSGPVYIADPWAERMMEEALAAVNVRSENHGNYAAEDG